MLGVLQVHYAQTSWSHVVCGPWGCGPPAEALAACHAAWLLVLAPITGLMIGYLPSSKIRIIAVAALALGFGGVIGVGVWQYFAWWTPASERAREYVVQRYFFSLACLVDFPAVQLLISGVVLRIGAILKSRRERADGIDHSSNSSLAAEDAVSVARTAT
ncbi:MAG: hypothetical protein DWQ34_07505 [Planctomycetota bacterium]|nr:MAG: hypothetical protein DWQ34_07505 [Planctomycetota bacterium]REJ95820.1 MAG: hypothetical protein DWQ29_01530 [Planctomycetota bacterium]REK27273.1 MAG: hypothetical protein DWQ41_07855 [Planctomycetota bacterium]REK36706.1 MAG: hypothetical protein DWQ45_08780 [Planctomycetota bacterium]